MAREQANAVFKTLTRLVKLKLVDADRGLYTLTPKGQKAVGRIPFSVSSLPPSPEK
jgi:hypothetical protein